MRTSQRQLRQRGRCPARRAGTCPAAPGRARSSATRAARRAAVVRHGRPPRSPATAATNCACSCATRKSSSTTSTRIITRALRARRRRARRAAGPRRPRRASGRRGATHLDVTAVPRARSAGPAPARGRAPGVVGARVVQPSLEHAVRASAGTPSPLSATATCSVGAVGEQRDLDPAPAGARPSAAARTRVVDEVAEHGDDVQRRGQPPRAQVSSAQPQRDARARPRPAALAASSPRR